MKPRLREYAAEDFDALYALDQICFDSSTAYSRRQLRGYLSLPSADCVVAEVEKKIVGFIVTIREGGRAYIVTIDVLPTHRRSSVGSSLLRKAEKRLALEGVREISLETAIDNGPAIRFWQKHGFRAYALVKEYYPGGRDAYSMTKEIAPARASAKRAGRNHERM